MKNGTTKIEQPVSTKPATKIAMPKREETRDEKVLRLTAEGLAPKEIAEQLQCHPLVVRSILSRNNLNTRDPENMNKPKLVVKKPVVAVKKTVTVSQEEDEDLDDDTNVEKIPLDIDVVKGIVKARPFVKKTEDHFYKVTTKDKKTMYVKAPNIEDVLKRYNEKYQDKPLKVEVADDEAQEIVKTSLALSGKGKK